MRPLSNSPDANSLPGATMPDRTMHLGQAACDKRGACGGKGRDEVER